MGLGLRRVVLQYPRLGWQGSTGIHGSFQSESVATFDWNRWQGSTGISGNLRPEYAHGSGSQVNNLTMPHQLLHFFHSSAWCREAVVAHWSRLVLAQHVAVMVQGRTVLLGDHTYVVKDARRMPGVVTLHQDSETQSKPPPFGGLLVASWA